jgi:hypothetical protein
MRLPSSSIRALVLTLLAGSGVSHAASGPTLFGAGSITVRSSAGDFRLTSAAGEKRLALPAGTEIEDLFALRQGAFLSGRAAPERPTVEGAVRRDLYLARIDGQGLQALPSPPRTRQDSGGVRENAVPLATPGGDLAGLVWLEGADRQSYAIRYAGWDGQRWSAAETVADRAPGSQLALSAATLDDGSRIVVWSRFDGHDDEIMASRFVDGRWSPAQPLAADNSVPDITPAVLAVPGGALATWGRYDGHDYRVVVSRFDGVAWATPQWAGPAGSTFPALTIPARAADAEPQEAGAAPAAWLTYASAANRGWAIVELDAAGRPLRQGAVAETPAGRPVLDLQPSGKIRLRWATAESSVELK